MDVVFALRRLRVARGRRDGARLRSDLDRGFVRLVVVAALDAHRALEISEEGRITVTPNPLELVVTDLTPHALTALGVASDGMSLWWNEAPGITWTSSDPTIATVDDHGAVTGGSREGTAEIRVRLGVREGTAIVRVSR